jgi:HK97 gp10 family phage protein
VISFDASELGRLSADIRSSAATVAARSGAAVRDAAMETRDAAKSLAPKLTGALAESITAEGDGLDWVVSPNVPYDFYVEYGTSKMPPQPFMSPAATVADTSLVEAIEEVADDTL